MEEGDPLGNLLSPLQHQKHPPEPSQESQGHSQGLRSNQDSETPPIGHPTGSLPWQRSGPSRVHPRGPPASHSPSSCQSNPYSLLWHPQGRELKSTYPSRNKPMHKGKSELTTVMKTPTHTKQQLEGQWVLWGFESGGHNLPGVPRRSPNSLLFPPSQRAFLPNSPFSVRASSSL